MAHEWSPRTFSPRSVSFAAYISKCHKNLHDYMAQHAAAVELYALDGTLYFPLLPIFFPPPSLKETRNLALLLFLPLAFLSFPLATLAEFDALRLRVYACTYERKLTILSRPASRIRRVKCRRGSESCKISQINHLSTCTCTIELGQIFAVELVMVR